MFLFILLNAPLFADSPPVKPEQKTEKTAEEERYKALLQTAEQLLKDAHYKQAIDAFARVYELSGKYEVLDQMAIAQERLGDYDAAIKTLLQYKSSAPEAQHPTIQRRVENLRKLKKALQKAEKQKVEEETTQSDLPRKPSSWLRYSMWSLAGIGTGTGITFGILKKSTTNKIEPLCVKNICSFEARSLIETETTYAIISDVGWGVGIIGLATSYYLSRKTGSPVFVGPGHFQWQTRF